VAPVVGPADIPRPAQVLPGTRLVEVTCLDDSLLRAVRAAAPAAVLGLRVPMGPGATRSIMHALDAGVSVAHLEADLHGRGTDGAFAPDHIRAVHSALVEAGCRDQVTLLAGGGFILAEHVAKGILCGLDAVAIDTAVLVALQGRMEGESRSREASRFSLPEASVDWAAARILNLLAAWHDQLLELMGAMGLREVRRMRGETGRIMFQSDLEQEAFSGIAGYDP
ncbi:MAG: glutamate synthase-related protein, partial [Anaerolineae bacterium]